MTRVSVVIPAYNRERTVATAIESVLAQSHPDVEVIAVDDGSADGTARVIEGFGDRVRPLLAPHRGQAPAINAGLGVATGDYVAYLDSDDVMLPDRLKLQAGYLDAHPEVDAVYSDQYRTSPAGTELIKTRPLDRFLILQRCYISRITILHRRSCLDRVGLFDETISGSDDWDMWLRMSECLRIDYLPGPVAEYRIDGSNTSFRRTKRLDHYRRTRLAILRKACARRGHPLWLRLMVGGAWLQYALGRVPGLGECSPRLWSAIDKVQWRLEQATIRPWSGLE